MIIPDRLANTERESSLVEASKALLEFVDEMAVALEAEGLPRMAGRIFSYLLICQPPEQTAAELGRELRASVGSVSTMTRLLVGAGLVERVSRAGHRADRFRVTPEGLSSLVAAGTARLTRYRRLSARGLGIVADQPPAARARLQELHDLYRFYEERMPALVEEWRRLRSDGES
jgi:DNA-binding MarR family transcriptional regulator